VSSILQGAISVVVFGVNVALYPRTRGAPKQSRLLHVSSGWEPRSVTRPPPFVPAHRIWCCPGHCGRAFGADDDVTCQKSAVLDCRSHVEHLPRPDELHGAPPQWRACNTVTLPLPVWDEYANEARITGRSITECLVSAIKRDYERKKRTLEPMETLDQNVRAFHAAATQLLQEARQVLERVGPLQEIGMRLSRIESAIGGRVVR
jgi:hypothetical protein